MKQYSMEDEAAPQIAVAYKDTMRRVEHVQGRACGCAGDVKEIVLGMLAEHKLYMDAKVDAIVNLLRETKLLDNIDTDD